MVIRYVPLFATVIAASPILAGPAAGQDVEHADLTADAELVVRIGAIEGADPYLFDSARRGLLTEDGSVIVADANELRFFALDGKHLKTMGREGAGPGEFRSISWILDTGESLVVYDSRQHRLTTFDGDEVATDRVPYPGTNALPKLVGLGPASSMAFVATTNTPSMHERDGDGYAVAATTKRLLLVQNGVVREILSGSFDRSFIARRGGHVTFGSEPLGPRMLVSGGSGLVAAGSSTSSVLRIFPWEQSAYEVDLAIPELALGRQGRSSFAADYLDESSSDARRANLQLVLDRMAWPENVPALEELLIDSDNRIWAKHHWLRGNPEKWTRVHPDTRAQLSVRLPPNRELLDARGPLVLLRTTDEFGTPSVEVWRIGRSDAGNGAS